MAGDAVQRFMAAAGELLKSESLDELPEQGAGSRRPDFFSLLLKSEALPQDPPSRGDSRTGGLRLFASESLPEDAAPAPAAGRPRFFKTLFSREALPVDAGPERSSRSSGK